MTEPEQLHPPQDETPREPKIIKRYTNRKLYDTVESRYVTLDVIAEMIKQGAEVKIVDNRTKDDLTSVTLAQIIFEEEKKKNQMPLSVLREIIRRPGDALHALGHLRASVEREVGERDRNHDLRGGNQHRDHAQAQRGRPVEHHHVLLGGELVQPLAEPLRRGR